MVTQKGDNTKVVGVRGNFDDCQSAVKAIFNDEDLKAKMSEKGYQFSSANSINIGRLVPQVAYYVYAYVKMVQMGELQLGETLNVVVPTGNFGNILAAYYAKNMGVPLGKLVCASNDNKVLYDFFETGIYDKNREFILTNSPSMDILISSNLERLIYMTAGNDAGKNSELMQQLAATGKYEITDEMKAGLSDFAGKYATEREVLDTISNVYQETGYVLDTHTAVAACAEKCYKSEKEDDTKYVIVSTASPYKFTRNVMAAVAPEVQCEDDFVLIDRLSEISKVEIPQAIKEIKNAVIRHDTVCEVNEMKDVVKESLGL